MFAQIGPLGWGELLLVLIIVLVVFGVGRIGRLGGELGQGISAFRAGLKEGQDETKSGEDAEVEA